MRRAAACFFVLLGLVACGPGDAGTATENVPSAALPDLSIHEPQVAEKLRSAMRAVERTPGEDAYVHLGRVLFAHFEWESARDAFLAGAALGGEGRFECLYLAGAAAAYSDGPVADATAILARAFAVRDEYAPARLRAGELAELDGRMDAAERHFVRALELETTSHALLGLARCATARGDDQGALQLLFRARTANRRHVEVLVVLAGTLSRLGRIDEALEISALVPPRHARTHFRDPLVLRARAESVSHLGLMEHADRAAAAGYPQDAIQFLDRAIAAAPDSVGARLRRAAILASGGQHEAVIAACRDIERIAPTCGVAWSRRGLSEVALGRVKDAEYSFRRGVSVDPGSAETRHELAVFLARDGAPGGGDEEARVLLEALIAEAPDQVASRALLARLLLRTGALGPARTHAVAVLRRAPGNAVARAVLAELE